MMSVSAQKTDSQSSPSVPRILLVDEQAHVLRVIRLNLERCGYLVDAVLSADLALQHVRKHCYDAVIMTSDLPDMTSAQLCERMQVLLDADLSDVPRPLFLVGRDEGVEWTCEVENREALSRPVSLKLILARLETLFEERYCIGAECL